MINRRLPKEYTRMFAEKAMELANLSLAGMVFVQFVGSEAIHAGAVWLGWVTFAVLHITAYLLMKGGEN